MLSWAFSEMVTGEDAWIARTADDVWPPEEVGETRVGSDEARDRTRGTTVGWEWVRVPLPMVAEEDEGAEGRVSGAQAADFSVREPSFHLGQKGTREFRRSSMSVEPVWGFGRDTGPCIVKSHKWKV